MIFFQFAQTDSNTGSSKQNGKFGKFLPPYSNLQMGARIIKVYELILKDP